MSRITSQFVVAVAAILAVTAGLVAGVVISWCIVSFLWVLVEYVTAQQIPDEYFPIAVLMVLILNIATSRVAKKG
jgi:hypothetical protein